MEVTAAREVLGLTEHGEGGADEKTIRRAYAKLAKRFRPDTHPDEFSRIRTAYDVLLAAAQGTATYQEPELTPAPIALTSETILQKPSGPVVSYVMDASNFSRAPLQIEALKNDVDNDAPPSYQVKPEFNPLQKLENELVDAIKVVQPGHAETENRVVELVDQYLSAAGRTSNTLRDYVERFMVGACLGDYYLPHSVRQKIADLCGLSTVLGSHENLKPWEQEFLNRFDESALVADLLQKAGSGQHAVEKSIVKGASWPRTLIMRLSREDTLGVHRWLHWLDQTFGPEFGVVDDSFRSRWKKLRQIEPITPAVILVFIAVMVGSGLALIGLGVPIAEFFSLPTASRWTMGLALAFLALNNAILVQLARPIARRAVSKARLWQSQHMPKAALVVEALAMTVLIWAWAMQTWLPDNAAAVLVVGAGMVLLLVALFTRFWDWLENLTFTTLALRLIAFRVAVIAAGLFTVSEPMKHSVWLVLGFCVLVLTPRPLLKWRHSEPDHGGRAVFSLRHSEQALPVRWIQVVLIVGGALGVAVTGLSALDLLPIGAHAPLVSVAQAMLLSLLALEMALMGSVFSDRTGAQRTNAFFAVLILLWLCTRLELTMNATEIALLALSGLLIWLAWRIPSES